MRHPIGFNQPWVVPTCALNSAGVRSPSSCVVALRCSAVASVRLDLGVRPIPKPLKRQVFRSGPSVERFIGAIVPRLTRSDEGCQSARPPTSITRHSLVNSSTTVRHFSRPSDLEQLLPACEPLVAGHRLRDQGRATVTCAWGGDINGSRTPAGKRRPQTPPTRSTQAGRRPASVPGGQTSRAQLESEHRSTPTTPGWRAR